MFAWHWFLVCGCVYGFQVLTKEDQGEQGSDFLSGRFCLWWYESSFQFVRTIFFVSTMYIYILFLWFNSSKLVNITIKWVVEIENYFTTTKKELYFLRYKKYYIESIQELHQKYEVLSQNFVGNHVLWWNHIIGQIRKHCYFQTILYKTLMSAQGKQQSHVLGHALEQNKLCWMTVCDYI